MKLLKERNKLFVHAGDELIVEFYDLEADKAGVETLNFKNINEYLNVSGDVVYSMSLDAYKLSQMLELESKELEPKKFSDNADSLIANIEFDYNLHHSKGFRCSTIYDYLVTLFDIGEDTLSLILSVTEDKVIIHTLLYDYTFSIKNKAEFAKWRFFRQ